MATEELYKVTIVGLQKDKGDVLDYLQENGVLHLSRFEDLPNEEGLERDRPLERVEEIVGYLLEFEWMTEHLGPYTKESVPRHFPRRTADAALQDAERLKAKLHDPLAKIVTSHNEITDEIESLENRRTLLESIPFDLEFAVPQDGRFTFTYLVRLPDTEERPDVRFPKNVTVLEEDDTLLIQGYRSDRDDVREIIKEEALSMVTVPELEKPRSALLDDIERRTDELAEESAALEKRLAVLARQHYGTVERLRHELQIFHDRYEASGQFLRTGETFMLEGFVPVSVAETVKRLGKVAKVHVEFVGLDDGPTKLRNLPYVRKFEFITKMFGVPEYGRVDPTTYISIFLPIFFGFMFSDIGYGILLAVTAWWLLRRATPDLPILSDSGYVLMVCAFTTALFGFFFGSFFGSLIRVEPLIFDPFVNAKWVLVGALILGLIHVNFGILTGMYEAARQSDVRKIVLEYVSILSLQAGAVLLAVGYAAPGWVLLGFALTLLVVKAGLMGLMDVTDFVGSWFSYARLLALSLATGGIALGVNIIAEQLNAVGLFGPVLFVLVVVFGHLFNFVLNVLGSSIHSVRLHYIEFFSQFYDGGGRQFREFTTRRVQDTI